MADSTKVRVVKVKTVPEVRVVKVEVPGIQGEPGESGDGGALNLLNQHIASAAPHPEYDDLPSLTLLFENGIV